MYQIHAVLNPVVRHSDRLTVALICRDEGNGYWSEPEAGDADNLEQVTATNFFDISSALEALAQAGIPKDASEDDGSRFRVSILKDRTVWDVVRHL